MGEVCAECESLHYCVSRLSQGVRYVCFRLDSWCVPAWPGTSLGSPASVMTEDPWLGVTSCGSPGSEMCHPQGRPAGASLPVGCFSCVQATGWAGGWMPFPESQGQVTGTLDSLIAGVRRSLVEILEAPQVSSALRPWSLEDSQLGLPLSISFPLLCTCVCVRIHRTRGSPLLYAPVAISLRLVPTHTIKAL